ncbi:MAG TPA: hypothetical protein PLQ54_16965, partial [Armatimonadota bacterium]|nr:hypothetical protein [Armatimonadota bacterium]
MGDADTQQLGSPESQQESQPAAAAKRPPVSRDAVVVLVLGLVLLLPLLYFSEAIVGAVKLQVWSK